MKPKRYNLGFGWFGPLEQSADGKLMLADEVLPLVAQKDNEINAFKWKYHEVCDDYLDSESFCTELNKENRKLIKDSNKLTFWLQVAATTAIIEAVLLVFAVWG